MSFQVYLPLYLKDTSTMEHVDTLLHARWIIPVEPDNTVLEHHSLAIKDGRIFALLPGDEARRRFQADVVLELSEHALIPGLINAHTHAAMSLFRGLADDLPLMEWLNNHIWPAEGAWVNPEFVRDGTQLAMAEMLKGGVTCFNDMYFFPDETAQAAARSRHARHAGHDPHRLSHGLGTGRRRVCGQGFKAARSLPQSPADRHRLCAPCAVHRFRRSAAAGARPGG